MQHHDVLILAAHRSPVGRPCGQFGAISAAQLVAPVLKATAAPAAAADVPLAEVILGNTVGPGGNLARLALLEADLPVSVPGLTIDRQCGSGLDAVGWGALQVATTPGVVVLAGGTESVSTSPMLRRLPNGTPYMARACMAPESLGDPDMADAAEYVAARYGISRSAQDAWAYRSIERTHKAADTGQLAQGRVTVAGHPQDEWRAKRLRPERLARYPSLVQPQEAGASMGQEQTLRGGRGGTVTAANSAPPADGAAVLLLGTESVMHGQPSTACGGFAPLGTIVAYAAAGVSPHEPGMGPVPALQRACQQAALRPADLDRVEINEAYAAQVLACIEQLDLEPESVNPEGGAIALGHPFGATGALLLVRLLYGLESGRYGAVSLGIGGGLGVAMIVRRY